MVFPSSESNSSPPDTRTVYIQGLPNTVTTEALNECFEPFGEIQKSNVITKKKAEGKGIGFLTYKRKEDADSVISMGEVTCDLGVLQVSLKKKKNNSNYSYFVDLGNGG